MPSNALDLRHKSIGKMLMKYIRFIFPNNWSIRVNQPMLLWLAFVTSCTKPASEQQQTADIQAVLQQVVMHKEIARFLNSSRNSYRLFRYEQLPVHNGFAILKPQFAIAIPNQRPFEHSVSMREENRLPFILLVERVIVDHDSAKVDLRITKQNLSGSFRLGKSSAGEWRVVRGSVSQE